MDTQNAKRFSSLDALRFGWDRTRANLRPFLVIGVVAGFLGLLQQAVSDHDGQSGIRPLLSLALQVAQLGATMALVYLALRANDGKPLIPERSDVTTSDFFSFLLTSVLYGLIVGCGLVLLVVPGVIWGLKFFFATFLVVDRQLDPWTALRESARLTRGCRWHLLGFAMMMLAVNIIGAFTFGVGLLITMPTTAVAMANVLRRMQAAQTAKEAPGTLSQSSSEGTLVAP